MTDASNLREIILDMLSEVFEGNKYSHTILKTTLKKHHLLQKSDRAFLSRIFTGTVQSYITLDYIINQFSTVKAHKMKPFIRNLLRMSTYQLIFMDKIPESAVCNEAVKLAKKRSFGKLSGFVNGVLRNIARKKEEISYPNPEKEPLLFLSVTYSTPEWLIKFLLAQYSYDIVETILQSSQKEKELSIRCNQTLITPQNLKKMLEKEGVVVKDSPYLEYAFLISGYDHLEALASFREGYFTVQDVSSMLVCEVAGIGEKDFVVDVCAAPGGKSLHAAQRARQVSARDLTAYKIHFIEENIQRLHADNVSTKVWDATVLDEELIRQADVVIADLPCSGMGVIGKKPDIKYKLSKEQPYELAKLQQEILKVVERYVKENGILIYSTCTINQTENQNNREWFLRNFNFEAVELDENLPAQLCNEDTKQGHLQLIQGMHNTDGFYIAKFRKKTAVTVTN